MSHPSYAKGASFERKCQAWLVHLGECVRSTMSRKPDLTLTASFRRWAVSCKKIAKGKMRYRVIRTELEDHDICMTAEDYDPFPMVHMYAPKFIELCAKAAAQDLEELAS